MYDLFFTEGAALFTVPAIVGTVFFALRLVLMSLGLSHDTHGPDAVDAHHGDSSEAFKALSIQGIAAFMMGFGWGGLGGLKGTDWGWTGAVACAILAGLAMLWLLGILLKGVYDLEASGNIPADLAVGERGTVYAAVPARGEGRGQVKLVIDQRQRIFNAVSSDEPLPTNTSVQVIHVNADNTLTVSRST